MDLGLSFGKDKKTWDFGEEPLPFTAFQFGNLLITDEDLLSDLAKAPKCNAVLEPEEDAMVALAEILMDFIFRFGIPKEIRVSNIIVEAGLEQICNVCGIKLRRIKRLKGLEEFRYSMQRFSL